MQTDSAGRFLAIAAETELRVWDLDTRRFLGPAVPHDKRISQLVFSPDGEWLVSVDVEHNFRAFATQTMQTNQVAAEPSFAGTHFVHTTGSLVSPRFVRRGTALITALEDARLEFRDLQQPQSPQLADPSVSCVSVIEPIHDEHAFVGGHGGGSLIHFPWSGSRSQ